jgi:hypothetical protein
VYRSTHKSIAIGDSDLINVRFYVAHGLALLFGLGTNARADN